MPELDFVLRTAGERTEQVCLELIKTQKEPHETVSILRERTHTEAVEKTILRALQSRADWVVAIDADMLLLPMGVSQIRADVRSATDRTFVVHPAIFDKQYGMRRWGVTAYRRTMLDEVNERFQKIKTRQDVKIEGTVIAEMQNDHNRVTFSRNVVAYHDFFQYYKSLYRKVYLNACRNAGMNDLVRKHWRTLSDEDSDYVVMMRAMDDALTERRSLANSVTDFNEEELNDKLALLGLDEKLPLCWAEFREQSLAIEIEEEMKIIEKHRVFNDFFDSPSPIHKASAVFRKAVSRFTS